MRWQGSRKSSNVQDYRGRGLGGRAGLGIGGTLIALIGAYFLGVDPRVLMGVMESVPATGQQEVAPGVPQDEQGQFMAAVLGDTEDTWTALFAKAGMRYTPATLVLFSDQVRTGCGIGSAGAGPFYCPADSKVYIDLSFYDELKTQFQAPGDFAQAYVLAHEVGHHVQNLLGTADKVRAAQQRGGSEQAANQMQVRMELQADCFAGVWAHNANRSRQILEQGDVEEALGAASAVGDDTIQKRTQGHVVPESFTHGTAQQRKEWFNRGLANGTIETCDTFSASL